LPSGEPFAVRPTQPYLLLPSYFSGNGACDGVKPRAGAVGSVTGLRRRRRGCWCRGHRLR
jgi:hypothetical protein